MDLPLVVRTAAARSAGLGRSDRSSLPWLHLAHDRWVRLEDAVDQVEHLVLLAQGLPPDTAYSHLTAAALLGAHLNLPARPHVVLTPRRVLPQRAEVVVHARRLAEQDVIVADGLRVTSGPQTFLDCAPLLPPDELCAVGDVLWRVGALSPESLAERLARAGRVRNVRRARAVAAQLDKRAMSRPESRFRWWLRSSDLPPVEVQVPVCDRWGNEVAHADLGWSTWRVLAEYEGRQHAETRQFVTDIDRYSLMGADGYLLLRFAARHQHEAVVVDRCRRALLSRGWRPERTASRS